MEKIYYTRAPDYTRVLHINKLTIFSDMKNKKGDS